MFAGMGLMSEAFAQILIPVGALIGIAFALVQWFLVSKIRVVSSGSENGCKDHLIEEDEQEEGVDSVEVVNKCAEIQNAISVGEKLYLSLYVYSCALCFFF